ncbi:hypothetical protein HMPREF9332_01775 [Alloprevotella rava F0323]|uniref:DNA mismatch repair protein MutL n=1 Tax=Alloprevotella rava F0323 TaxID=679199 RepID=G5GDX3_9BACT|nr:DNA mismatch repair endonuclease MutL [Alloprevotella rava]EHG21256.1 hypothetical protein HMPREF9332_01775 [Alloprevotella rava F0323]
MSDIIHLLPDTVANQIAAGEVIQRPSSVIKELVENSIDAGAALIQVYVVEAGKTSIQVIDNGKGMSETDARLAFERHATSKIREASDLFNLCTMGFRGEALPSIVAVAQVELRTRQKDKELGICLQVEGGKFKEEQLVACPIGANFMVRNLFFNVPARRKFLKSNQTELSNIVQEFERIALAHPAVSFKLYSNGTLMHDLVSGNFRQRISGVFGRKMDQQLIPICADTEIAKITGFVGCPESSRKKGVRQYFFVNGRFMRHPYFSKAVQSAFDRLIPENEQVPYFLNFEVDPQRIDVNIHPTKTEVKFQDEQELWQIILAGVRDALSKFNAVPTIDFDTDNRPQLPVFDETIPVQQPRVHIDHTFNPFKESASRKTSWEEEYNRAFGLNRSVQKQPSLWEQENEKLQTITNDISSVTEFSGTDYLQFRGRYIVVSVKSGLMFVDQNRAHSRILYDKFRQQLKGRTGTPQGILFPPSLHLTPVEKIHFDEIVEDLKALGFEFSDIDADNITIKCIPADSAGVDPECLVRELLEASSASSYSVREDITNCLALGLARKSAMPIGELLDTKQMANLLSLLFSCSMPNYTPDGLPTLSILQNEQVDALF